MKLLLTTILASILIGCGGTTENKATAPEQVTKLPESFFTTERPRDVKDLVEVKKTAKKGDEVTFLSRIGGRKNSSFVPTLSMMIVADPALKSCEVMSEEDHCATPEDYCCEDRDLLRAGLGTIRFMDESGDAYPFSVDGDHGLEILKYVVITGKVHDISDNGNFIVDASRVWVGGKPLYSDLRAGSGE
ncbi:MAG: hypothetical protein ISR75_06035 [Phycisphaerales bacterium]|nr:hypothetical protein [Planctomycetota bacterium]MBL6997980.1 hypothetical protein [Phycisphaerales bacterium]